MFRKCLAVILSCIMMTIPVVAFAEATEAVEIAKTPDTVEAKEIAEIEKPETTETVKTIETVQATQKAGEVENVEGIDEPQSMPILRAPASNFPFVYMYPENLQSFNGSKFKEEIISNGSDSGVGAVSRTYETTQLHFSGEINLTIRQRGYFMSGLSVKAEGAEIWGDPAKTLDKDPSTGAVIEWRHPYKFSNIDPDISRLVIRATGKPIQTSISDLYERIIIVNFDDHRGPAPESPTFAMSSTNPNKYTLAGVDSTMEYRLKEGKTWTSCADSEMIFDVPNQLTKYYVRYKATASTKESQVKEIAMTTIPGAPDVSYSTTTEKFSGITKNMEISINDASFIPVTDEIIETGVTPYIDALSTTSGSIKVRKIATATSPVSRQTVLNIYPRRAMPTGLKLDPNTYVLTGVTSEMQYRGEGKNWDGVGYISKSLYLVNYAKEDMEGFVEVRMAAGKTSSASLPQKITLQKMSPKISGLTIDYHGEVITGFNPNEKYLYKESNFSSWSSADVVNGKMNVASIASISKEVTLDLRQASSSHAPIGAITKITLPKVLPAPTAAKFVYNISSNIENAVLINVPENMEYRESGKEWISGNSKGNEIKLPQRTVAQYYVRVKATDNSFPSKQQSLQMFGKVGEPEVTYNSTTEMLSGIKNTMEYSINGAGYIKIGSQTALDLSSIIDSIKQGEITTLTVRTMPAEKYPVSKEKVYKLYPRKAEPTGLVFDKVNSKLTGVNGSMQFREAGTKEWKPIYETKELNLKTFINGRTNVVLEVRYAPKSNSSASKSTRVNLY